MVWRGCEQIIISDFGFFSVFINNKDLSNFSFNIHLVLKFKGHLNGTTIQSIFSDKSLSYVDIRKQAKEFEDIGKNQQNMDV